MKKRIFTAPSQKIADIQRINNAILEVLLSNYKMKTQFNQNESLKK